MNYPNKAVDLKSWEEKIKNYTEEDSEVSAEVVESDETLHLTLGMVGHPVSFFDRILQCNLRNDLFFFKQFTFSNLYLDCFFPILFELFFPFLFGLLFLFWNFIPFLDF